MKERGMRSSRTALQRRENDVERHGLVVRTTKAVAVITAIDRTDDHTAGQTDDDLAVLGAGLHRNHDADIARFAGVEHDHPLERADRAHSGTLRDDVLTVEQLALIREELVRAIDDASASDAALHVLDVSRHRTREAEPDALCDEGLRSIGCEREAHEPRAGDDRGLEHVRTRAQRTDLQAQPSNHLVRAARR